MQQLPIATSQPYTVYLSSSLSELPISTICQGLANRLVIISDHHLYPQALALQQHLASKEVSILTFPAGEAYKTRETKAYLEDSLLQAGHGRDSGLIALGGGVVCDLTGFVAATYQRGIPSIYLPTSLVAMVDASIGGKTALNTPFAKNCIGCFHQPAAVFIATDFLNSLPLAEFQQGCVELLKHFLLADAKSFEDAMAEPLTPATATARLHDLLLRSINIKRIWVEQDEYDQGIRKLLNLGHTFGHAIEACSNYQIPHGFAVAMGIVAESYIGTCLGILAPEDLMAIQQAWQRYGLPLQTEVLGNYPAIYAAFQQDKKKQGTTIHLPLLTAIGQYYHHPQGYTHAIPDELLRQACAWAHQQFK